MRLLICEDEEDILNGLAKGLRKLNYYVDTAMDGEEALSLYFESEYDLIVLDLNMPNPDCKVIILSARDTLNDKVLGLDLGANDYMVKPFHFKELEARIRALLRTSYSANNDCIKLDSHGITLFVNKKQVQKDGENIALTPKEYAIFEYLCLHKDTLVSADELLEHNVDMNASDASGVIKVHIAAIRKKLGSDVIKTNRGMGYTIND